MSLSQKNYVKWCLGGSLFFILLSFHLDNILMRFLLVGELPGNQILLSPDAMLAICCITLLIVMGVIANSFILKQSKTPQHRLPTRRYQSIQ